MNQTDWLEALAGQENLAPLFAPPPEERQAAGYGHTLVEICQQPVTWAETAERVLEARARLLGLLDGCQWVVLTGSGSSQFAGECVHPALQRETGLPVFTLGGGWLLLDGFGSVPRGRPGLLVSLARSGDSPESAGVLDCFLEADPEVRHLVITCNREGRLTTRFGQDPHVMVLPLDPRTNDRSLAMTSSFTNIVVASRALGLLREPAAYSHIVGLLVQAARFLLLERTAVVAALARTRFARAVYLAGGCRFGAAREAALKMLEMNSGRIPTMAETYLGLRHGPMCFVDPETLVVCFLDSEPLARAYEEDLLAELNAKNLGARKLVVGENIPASLLRPEDVAIEVPGLAALGDANAAVLDVVVGQLLAFFRCLEEGLRPDAPSDGVINRVVNEFTVHRTPPRLGSPAQRAVTT